MSSKKILPIVLVLLIIGVLVYLFTTQNQTVKNTNSNNINTSETADTGRRVESTTNPEQPVGKLKVANFAGKLEEVNTGCFADGECYVVVSGKHITTLMGWSQEVVGSLQGVDSIGDLEGQIGRQVEVYAQDKGDGTYTLYGNSGFYVKLVK